MVRVLSGGGRGVLIRQRPRGGEESMSPVLDKEHSKQWEQKIESFQDGEKLVISRKETSVA